MELTHKEADVTPGAAAETTRFRGGDGTGEFFHTQSETTTHHPSVEPRLLSSGSALSSHELASARANSDQALGAMRLNFNKRDIVRFE